MPLLDAHLHLHHTPLKDRAEELLVLARAADVRLLVVCGSRGGDWEELARLAVAHAEILPCFGLHPWRLGELESGTFARLETLLREFPAGVGEIGLDRGAEASKEIQFEVFRRQWQLAVELRRPAILHVYRAWDWLAEVLSDQPTATAGVVFHGFGASPEVLRAWPSGPTWFSFGTSLLDPKRDRLREVARLVPADRLLLETDAPYGFVVGEAGPTGQRTSQPADVVRVYEEMARLRGNPSEALECTIWENARRLFAPLGHPAFLRG